MIVYIKYGEDHSTCIGKIYREPFEVYEFVKRTLGMLDNVFYIRLVEYYPQLEEMFIYVNRESED